MLCLGCKFPPNLAGALRAPGTILFQISCKPFVLELLHPPNNCLYLITWLRPIFKKTNCIQSVIVVQMSNGLRCRMDRFPYTGSIAGYPANVPISSPTGSRQGSCKFPVGFTIGSLLISCMFLQDYA